VLRFDRFPFASLPLRAFALSLCLAVFPATTPLICCRRRPPPPATNSRNCRRATITLNGGDTPPPTGFSAITRRRNVGIKAIFRHCVAREFRSAQYPGIFAAQPSPDAENTAGYCAGRLASLGSAISSARPSRSAMNPPHPIPAVALVGNVTTSRRTGPSLRIV